MHPYASIAHTSTTQPATSTKTQPAATSSTPRPHTASPNYGTFHPNRSSTPLQTPTRSSNLSASSATLRPLAPSTPPRVASVTGQPQLPRKVECSEQRKRPPRQCLEGLLTFVVLAGAKTNTPRIGEPHPDQGQSTHRYLRSRITRLLRDDVVRLYLSGLTSRAVAEETKIGKTTVLKILKQEGVEVRPLGVHY